MKVFSKRVTLRALATSALARSARVGRVILGLQVIAGLTIVAFATASAQTHNASSASGALQDVVWLASPSSNSCTGPTDASGHVWTDPAFDEAGWVSVSLPDQHYFQDRYYRGHLQLAATAADLSLFLNSDDGSEMFVNGSSLGAFGGACHAFGCANRPGSCRANQCVPPLALNESQLTAGDNVLAVHVSNGGGGVFFNATVLQGNSGNCGNCRLDAGEQCDPTVTQGACLGYLCGDLGTPNACTCPAAVQ